MWCLNFELLNVRFELCIGGKIKNGIYIKMNYLVLKNIR